jgi:protein-disulfide isomerase
MRRELGRRDALALVGVGLVGTAGCLGSDDGDTGGGDDGTDTSGSGGADGSGNDGTDTGGADHAALRAVDEQPALGPPPGEATATIVAFEDPSCQRCRAFERETVPRIREELVEPGTATFVFRGYPVVYDWGEPAATALEAAYARDSDAHWALADHYYAEQPSFDAGNVLDRTASFLDGETDLDGSAVVEAVEAGAPDDVVQTDLDAGEAADATVTPTVFLFRDGEYRTTASGSISYDAVESALGL